MQRTTGSEPAKRFFSATGVVAGSLFAGIGFAGALDESSDVLMSGLFLGVGLGLLALCTLLFRETGRQR